MFSVIRKFCLATILIVSVSSCGDSLNGTYTAANGNTVTFDGKNIKIMFVTESFEISDKQQKFSGDGFVKNGINGTYKVTGGMLQFSNSLPIAGPGSSWEVPFSSSDGLVVLDGVEYKK